MAPMLIPTTAVSAPEYFTDPCSVAFFSLFIKAILYIAFDGELRVNRECSRSNEYLEQSILAKCQEINGSRLCMYASASEEHLLAMDPSTGVLTTVRKPKNQPSVTPAQGEPCVWFEETYVHDTQARIVRIVGCPTGIRQTLSIAGENGQNKTCAPYMQRSSNATSNPNHSSRFFLGPPGFTSGKKCENASAIASSCPGMSRQSYPLHFNKCSH